MIWFRRIFLSKKYTKKTFLPNPNCEYKFILKKKVFKNIMELKGWRTYNEAGKELGFTRQYISMIVNGKARITSEFMARLAVLLGNADKGWWQPYSLVPTGSYEKNHPHWNQEKHMGRMPYSRHSSMGHMRKVDYDCEIESL